MIDRRRLDHFLFRSFGCLLRYFVACMVTFGVYNAVHSLQGTANHA